MYMQRKLAITVIVITLALFALIYQIYRIINGNQDNYNQIVLSQQEYDSRVIPYRRGDIVDRNGTYLATTEKVYNLIIDPSQIMADEENFLEATVSALVQVFDYDAQELRTLIREDPKRLYIRYKRHLEYDQKQAFETLQSETNRANAEAGERARIRGVWFEDEYRRIYPNNALACNVVGFSTNDNGIGGIEQSYNEDLIGTNGREYGYLNDDSNLERVIKSAENGNTVVSTIDVNIQNIVEKYIAQWMDEVGSNHIGVIVMDPDNGEVLAMASDEPFDLNNPRAVSDRYTEEELMELGRAEAVNVYKNRHRDSDGATITADEVSEYFEDEDILSYGRQVAWNQEWRNYCVSDTYEPGSPAKIFTVAAALEEGVIGTETTFFCDGYQTVGDYDIKCTAYSKGGHGLLTLEETLMQSCNDAMMQIAALTGKTRFSRYQQMFGFGAKTGIDLPGEADTGTLVYTEETMGPTELATNSFGQTFNCTMIQMAAAYCSVINGGSYYVPHVVKQILNEQGSIVRKVDATLVRETVSESTAAFIREALFETVEQGTGKAAQIEGYAIAGKTGTAEKLPRKQGNYLVSFCGFAPAEDPEVLVYVVVDEPHVDDQAHSTYASGVFAEIMGDILPYLNVFPEIDEESEPEIAAQLPDQEGITENTGETNGETEVESEPESKAYDTEEYVSPEVEQDSGIPNVLPGTDEEGPRIVIEQDDTAETASATTASATTAAATTKAATTKAEATKAAATKAASDTTATKKSTSAASATKSTTSATAATTAAATAAASAGTTTAAAVEETTQAAVSQTAAGNGTTVASPLPQESPVGDQPGGMTIIAPYPGGT